MSSESTKRYDLYSRDGRRVVAHTFATNYAQARATFDDCLGIGFSGNAVSAPVDASGVEVDGSVVLASGSVLARRYASGGDTKPTRARRSATSRLLRALGPRK